MQEVDDPDRRDADRTVGRSRSRQHDRKTGVVDLGVEVPDAARQRVVAQGRHRPQARAARQVPMARHCRVQTGERVVEKESRAHVETLPGPVLEREQERCGMDEMRGDLLNQEPPLMERFADQPDVEALEVAQPAVDQLAGTARGSGGEVALFDQGHRQAAAGSI